MGEEYIKKTQDTLGKLIKKPPMSEKLLKKPPFRFLHDVFTEVIKTTGFMKGLFTEHEMNASNVKEKDDKIAFLQKAIDLLSMVTGKSLGAKPSKIVAGHEPEKTNELLQALASALSKKLDSTESVKKILKGEKGEKGEKGASEKPPRPKKDDDKKGRDTSADKRNRDNKEKSSSDNRQRSGSRDRAKDDKNRDGSKDRSSKDRDRSKDREKDRSRDRKEDKSRSKDKEKSRDKDRDKERSRDKDREKDREHRDKDKDREQRGREKEREPRDKERSKEKERSRDKDREREKDKEKSDSKEKDREERDKERRERRRRKEEEASKQQTQNEEDESDEYEDFRSAAPEGEDGSGGNRIPRPSSAKGSRRRPTKESDDADVERQESAKQRSRPKESEESGLTADDALPPQVVASRRMARPSSARPAPPKVKKQESLDDGSRVGSGKQNSSVIVDNANNTDDEDDIFVVEDSQPVVDDESRPTGGDVIEDDGEHGGLVKKILETKKELEGTQNKQEEKPVMLDPARRKERELVQREVEKMRGAIQTLTRSANPLGKIMDYLQEDVDSMQKELEMWQRENRDHVQAIKREQSITDSELEPLNAQLAQLDQSIEDQLDTIAAVKSSILRNEEKISKMVNSIAFTR